MDDYYKERLAVAVEWATNHDYDSDVYAVAVWIGESGSTYTWPQGLKDNRRSRVLARIMRRDMERPLPYGLVIINKQKRK